MKADIKRCWVEALRSGEYEQGTGYLNANGEYCCLGVLCDLAVKDGLPLSVRPREREVIYYDDTPSDLPRSVQEWAGLNDSCPWVENDLDIEGRETLAALNDGDSDVEDGDPLSFERIADIIEAQSEDWDGTLL